MKKILVLIILLFTMKVVCMAQLVFKVDSIEILNSINTKRIKSFVDTTGIINGPLFHLYLCIYNDTDSTITLKIEKDLFKIYFLYQGKEYVQSLLPAGGFSDNEKIGIFNEKCVTLLPTKSYYFSCSTRPFYKTSIVKNIYEADHTLELLQIVPTLTVRYNNTINGNTYETRGMDHVSLPDREEYKICFEDD